MFGASPFAADPFAGLPVVAVAGGSTESDAGDWETFYHRRKKKRRHEIEARAQVDAAFAAWLALFTATPVPKAPPVSGPAPGAAVSVSPVERVLAAQAATARRHEARQAYEISTAKAQQAKDRIAAAVVRYKLSHAKAQYHKSKRASARAAYMRSKAA